VFEVIKVAGVCREPDDGKPKVVGSSGGLVPTTLCWSLTDRFRMSLLGSYWANNPLFSRSMCSDSLLHSISCAFCVLALFAKFLPALPSTNEHVIRISELFFVCLPDFAKLAVIIQFDVEHGAEQQFVNFAL
jgi:hypothetical protein